MRFMLMMLAFLTEAILGFSRRRNMFDMLKRDKDFHDQWVHLVEMQDRQRTAEAINYPLEGVSDVLTECASYDGEFHDRADNIRPQDIDVYVEMGHLARYCTHNMAQLLQGDLEPCTQPGYAMELPSLDKFIRVFNENLTVVESTVEAKLKIQRKFLINQFNKTTEWNNKWKLIVILPSLQDGEATETGQAAIEVLETIEELHSVIPNRTIIVVVRASGRGLWEDAIHTHQACRIILEGYQFHSRLNSESIWDQIETICELNYQSDLFSVQILPLLNDAALTNLPDKTMDLSMLGYNCAHLSERGLSLLHINVWNSLLTKQSERTHHFRPRFVLPHCVDPQCPFIRTHNNSALCLWNKQQSKGDEARRNNCEQLIALIALLSATVPCIVLMIILCYGRKHYEIKELKCTRPILKSVGDDWSSIRFIDEDSVC